MKLNNQKAFVSLLGLLLAIGIICFIGFKAYDIYLKKPIASKEDQKFFSDQGIDTSSQLGTFHSTKEKIKDVNRILLDREKQLLETQP